MPSNIKQRFVYKINSSRLKSSNWNLDIGIDQAILNDELIASSESQFTRFIDKINGVTQKEINEVTSELRAKIKSIKKMEKSFNNTRKLIDLYRKLNKNQFVEEYVCIVMENKSDFNRAKRGFYINGLKYKRFVGTTNGVKKNSILFVCEKNTNDKIVFDRLNKLANNGRNMLVKFVPAKFEAYKSLICSSSIPVSEPNKVIVVRDCFTKFKSDYIQLDDSETIEPKMDIVRDGDIELNVNDGFGLISPSQAKKWSEELGEDFLISGFCVRNSFCKGMLNVFDFHLFRDTYASDGRLVEDVWGNYHDIKEVDVVLTESMLKLWHCYDSYDDYKRHCDENGYTFAVTKTTPEELDNVRELNYQFIQTYDFSDRDIYELCKPTINEIKDVLGLSVDKTILFSKGCELSEDRLNRLAPDVFTALMIEPTLIQDSYVRNKIYSLIKKRINLAKIGKLKVNGNFQVLSGDPFALCQSMFGLEVTGILKSGECYSRYWIDCKRDVGELACFRSPMSSANNIVKLNLNTSKDAQFWYQYMNTMFILNAWDMTTHSLNGADDDGDLLFSTDNEVLCTNTKKNLPILCIQKTAPKFEITEDLLFRSNKNAFGDDIGFITNVITAFFDLLSLFKKGSREYKELNYRIICGQQLQQNSIDAAKGVISKGMPKKWYNLSEINKDESLSDEEKQFYSSICANKKPYFMNYIYPNDMKIYKTFIDDTERKCLSQFGMSINDLKLKKDKTEEEEQFLYYYNRMLPCTKNTCVMNKVCYLVESEFDGILSKLNEVIKDFDYSILKTPDVTYSKKQYNTVLELYKKYHIKIQEHAKMGSKERLTPAEIGLKKALISKTFREELTTIIPNEDVLTNVVVDIAYDKNKTRNFAWDIVPKQIIKNLLVRNNNIIKIIEKSDDGNINFNGETFKESKVEWGGFKLD